MRARAIILDNCFRKLSGASREFDRLIKLFDEAQELRQTLSLGETQLWGSLLATQALLDGLTRTSGHLLLQAEEDENQGQEDGQSIGQAG